MNSLLNPDNPVMRFITKTCTAMYLSLLWLLCSLPIFTIGAATTALYDESLKLAKDEDGNITSDFFHSFKENFRQSTIVWLILLALGIVLGIDGYVLWHVKFDSIFWTLCSAVFILVIAAYVIVLLYVFPLMARFENTARAMLKNSLLIGMRFLVCTALMAAIYFAMACIVINLFTPLLPFAMGLCAFFCSYLLKHILAQCEEKAVPAKQEVE